MQFSKTTVAPFTKLELLSHGFKSMKVNQHLPWSAQWRDLNISEPLWTVLETRVRNRFQPPISLKQLEDVLQEEWHKILPETVQNLYKSIPRRIAAVLKEKVVQHHIEKEMCTVSVVCPLFCPSLYILQSKRNAWETFRNQGTATKISLRSQ
jgi:hypothetical protein